MAKTVSLRSKMILVTTGILVILFGFSEWLSYHRTSALLQQHEDILIQTTDHTLALAKLQETRNSMFVRVTTLRLMHAALALLLAVMAVNYVWYKFIYGRIRSLLTQIHIMGRGTWNAKVQATGNDEIAQIATAFNHLGGQLAETVRYIHTSSQLSAFALVGNRLIRQINIARGQISTATELLRKSGRKRGGDQEAVLTILDSASSSLQSIERHFETAFERQFQKVSAEYRDVSSGPSTIDGSVDLEPLPRSAAIVRPTLTN